MLVLSRKLHEKICFPGFNTTVEVVGIKSGTVRLGIQAPAEVTVLREEVPDRNAEWAQPADSSSEGRLRQLDLLLRNRLQITSAGLDLLRQQIQAGSRLDAYITLDKLEEDLQMLRQRLEDEVSKSLHAVTTSPARLQRALIVEDNVNERELLATFLRNAGLDVATAGDGIVALEYLRQRQRPDVVLLDMGLPNCDGPTMVRQLRRDPEFAGLKIFAVSGYLPQDFNLDYGPNGVDRWFHKPIDPLELVRDLHQEFEKLPNGSKPASEPSTTR